MSFALRASAHFRAASPSLTSPTHSHNRWPCVDNDDGSSNFWVASNLCIYGGGKNYLGDTKVWDGNLFVAPNRWSGDPCLNAWRGANHVFTNNTCLMPTSGSPNYFDSTPSGASCAANYSDPAERPFLPTFANNKYITYKGQFTEGCSGELSLGALNALGQELGSTVTASYTVEGVVAQALELLA